MIFWNWWTTTVLTYLGFSIATWFGAYHFILANDPTYISFIILGLFSLANLYAGYKAWEVGKQKKVYDGYGPLWFTSDALLTIGMIGTLIGFLTVLTTAFGDIDTGDPESMKMVIGQLATGMGTALLTTLTGLITSLVLKTQLVNIESVNEEVSQ